MSISRVLFIFNIRIKQNFYVNEFHVENSIKAEQRKKLLNIMAKRENKYKERENHIAICVLYLFKEYEKHFLTISATVSQSARLFEIYITVTIEKDYTK